MSLQKINKAPTKSEINDLKRKYHRLEKKYDQKKYQFTQAVGAEDFEVLSVRDFLELKELYILSKKLYWDIYKFENPDDTATVEAYRFLNSMGHNDQIDFLRENGLTTHRLIDAIRENPNFIDEVTA